MPSIIPKSFVLVLPLQIGAEMICGLGIFNRASGFYGFLSLFTGHPLTALEWLLNLLSLIALPIYLVAFRAVGQRNALLTVLFAYIYTLDTFATLMFTISFSVVWFSTAALSVSDNHHKLTSPTNDTISGNNSSSPLSSTDLDKSASLASETAVSMVVPIALILIRFYFTLVVLAYSRLLVRQQNLRPHNGQPKGSWNAKLQSLLLSMFQQFWYGGSWAPAPSYKQTSVGPYEEEEGEREGQENEALTANYQG